MHTTTNILDNISATFEKEVFENLLITKHLKLERILSKGHVTPQGEWYDQDQNEWVLLLKGAASIKIAKQQELVHLKAGDYLLIPAHQKHRVEWTSSEEVTVWLALFY